MYKILFGKYLVYCYYNMIILFSTHYVTLQLDLDLYDFYLHQILYLITFI